MVRFLILTAILMLGFTSFALADDEKALLAADRLISTGLMNPGALEELRAISANLTATQKYILFQKNKKDFWLSSGLNCCVPLGIGNFILGDTANGLISGGGFVLCEVLYFMNCNYDSKTTTVGSTTSTVVTITPKNSIATIASTVGLAFWIWGIVSPGLYTSSWNKNLEMGLSIYEEKKTSVYLDGNRFDNNSIPGMVMNLNYRF